MQEWSDHSVVGYDCPAHVLQAGDWRRVVRAYAGGSHRHADSTRGQSPHLYDDAGGKAGQVVLTRSKMSSGTSMGELTRP
jgi:hypothetical protein